MPVVRHPHMWLTLVHLTFAVIDLSPSSCLMDSLIINVPWRRYCLTSASSIFMSTLDLVYPVIRYTLWVVVSGTLYMTTLFFLTHEPLYQDLMVQLFLFVFFIVVFITHSIICAHTLRRHIIVMVTTYFGGLVYSSRVYSMTLCVYTVPYIYIYTYIYMVHASGTSPTHVVDSSTFDICRH